jgi:hypothetical protein
VFLRAFLCLIAKVIAIDVTRNNVKMPIAGNSGTVGVGEGDETGFMVGESVVVGLAVC